MNIKSEKGIAGIDIAVAIMIITIFVGLIATLYQNYNLTSKEIERKAQAIQYAIQEIEEIKSNSQEYFNDENREEEEISIYNKEHITEGYYRTVTITDYAKGKEGKQLGYAKEVKVIITYKIGKQEKTVELETVISKES